jgi:hypothetical protein
VTGCDDDDDDGAGEVVWEVWGELVVEGKEVEKLVWEVCREVVVLEGVDVFCIAVEGCGLVWWDVCGEVVVVEDVCVCGSAVEGCGLMWCLCGEAL